MLLQVPNGNPSFVLAHLLSQDVNKEEIHED